ncbi:uncharacterized protein [Clytia hemisphaerica]|uniref:uncharacterized protein n=1 Tax=Clytia hemisphaerica TaxID=252671 RepID=UPI0034D61D84
MATKTTAKCVQYADDTTIYRHTKPNELEKSVTEMNSDISVIEKWSLDSNLIFNARKTKSISLPHLKWQGGIILNSKIKSNNENVIERVPLFKLLGIIFTENLTWNEHVKKIVTKAYGTLKSLSLIKRYLPYRVRRQLAESLVLSKIDYGNTVIHNAPQYLFNQLQRVQNATASFVRKSYSRKSDVIDMKWLPVKERTEYSLLNLRGNQ